MGQKNKMSARSSHNIKNTSNRIFKTKNLSCQPIPHQCNKTALRSQIGLLLRYNLELCDKTISDPNQDQRMKMNIYISHKQEHCHKYQVMGQSLLYRYILKKVCSY